MAYDEELADRVRELVSGAVEKKMFGGLAFLIGGHMSVAVSGQGGLMVRCDPAQTEALLAEPGADLFEMRGRSMAGWLRVEAEAVEDDEVLGQWVDVGVAYASSLPPQALINGSARGVSGSSLTPHASVDHRGRR